MASCRSLEGVAPLCSLGTLDRWEGPQQAESPARERRESAAATPRGSLDNLRNVTSQRLNFPTSQQGPSFLPRAWESF